MTPTRRHFIKQLGILAGGMALNPSLALGEKTGVFDFKISLAQWSLHKALFAKKLDPLDFPVVAKTLYGVEGVEYVNQFFLEKAKDTPFLTELKKRADDNGVKSLLIMVDQEGSLASTDSAHRQEAVEKHYKWVEAAKFLGCHSIRVNLHGEGNEEEWKKASIDGLGKLVEFAAKSEMNVIVENHGQWSSKGNLVADVMKAVNNPYCGTLPDFGNFCVRRRDGDLWESPCVEYYDKYKGVEEMMPYAKGVSAKSFDFDEKGNETTIDFRKMLALVRKYQFKGYLGIEYEGNRLSEHQGILATKKLLEKVREELR
jgi:sugar phosphate isomerase/epimerase